MALFLVIISHADYTWGECWWLGFSWRESSLIRDNSGGTWPAGTLHVVAVVTVVTVVTTQETKKISQVWIRKDSWGEFHHILNLFGINFEVNYNYNYIISRLGKMHRHKCALAKITKVFLKEKNSFVALKFSASENLVLYVFRMVNKWFCSSFVRALAVTCFITLQKSPKHH